MTPLVCKLEIYHSRPMVPTRRVALGEQILLDAPTQPNSEITLGGLLLAAVVGKHASNIHPDLWDDLELLIKRVERGAKIPQPFMRFRLQTDKVGLAFTTHTLTQHIDGSIILESPSSKNSRVAGASVQQLLGALYVAATLPSPQRTSTIAAIRFALSWWGSTSKKDNERLLNYLLEGQDNLVSHNIGWALDRLDIKSDEGIPTGAQIQRYFRQKLWRIHPDRGGDPAIASQLIPELAEARRILLASST